MLGDAMQILLRRPDRLPRIGFVRAQDEGIHRREPTDGTGQILVLYRFSAMTFEQDASGITTVPGLQCLAQCRQQDDIGLGPIDPLRL